MPDLHLYKYMTNKYNKANTKTMDKIQATGYSLFSGIPFQKAVDLLKRIQSKDTGAIVFGASGEMGSKITSTFPRVHARTMMQDIDPERLEQSKSEAYTTLGKGVEKRKVPERAWVRINRDGLLAETVAFPDGGKIPFDEINTAYANSPDAAREVVNAFLDSVLSQNTEVRTNYGNLMMVLEAGPEVLPFKQNVFKFFELALKSPNAVLATNTSSLSVDDIAAKLEHPERAVGFHYFFPAHINPLLEIIAGSQTSPEVVEAMRELAICMGKKPIICWKDRPGAVANRILVGILNEAGKMADEGIATPDVIDEVFLETFYPKQIKIQTQKAKTQFEAAPKLAFFKDESKLYREISECERQRSNERLIAKQPNLRNELLAKKLTLLQEAQGRLRQKVLYAGIVENLAVLGSFYKPADCVGKVKSLAKSQLDIINKYLAEVKTSPAKLIQTVEEVTGRELEPYQFPEAQVPNLPITKQGIKNRLQGAYIAIAQEILKEGLATPQDIELTCKEGFKYNVGPFELAGELGRDKSLDLISLVNQGLDQSKPTGISKPGEYIELAQNDLSGVQTYIQNDVGFINLGRIHIQNLQQTQNSLSPEMLNGISEALRDLQQRGVKAIVLRSQGGGPFSAGADLNYIESTNWDETKLLAFMNLGKKVMDEIAGSKIPTIAVVDGAAVGGGAELALACDYRVFTDLSVIAFPEVGLGIIPDWGGTERLPAVVGKSLAKALICTAKLKNLGLKLGGEDCYRVGLADAFVTQAELPHLINDLLEGKGPFDISIKPPPKANYERKTEEYPAHIVKRFGLSKPFQHNRRWVTKQAARFAEDLIDHSDDLSYAPRVNNDAAFLRLLQSGRKVANRYIKPVIYGVQNKFLAPILEKLGLG